MIDSLKLFVLLIAGSIAAFTHAGVIEGKSAFKRNDFPTAFREFKSAAELGQAEAQYRLGILYEQGLGTEQSYANAHKAFELAADQGFVPAQTSLGFLFLHGKGGERGQGKVMQWNRLAANQGSVRAQVNLGYVFLGGTDTPKNFSEAVIWFRTAAEQGDADGQFNLGYAYDNSIGVEGDEKEAAKGDLLAAQQGHGNAQAYLGNIYANGQGVAQSFIEALKWYRLAAEQGNSRALNNLGSMYQNGTGVVANSTIAYALFHRSNLFNETTFATQNQRNLSKSVPGLEFSVVNRLVRKMNELGVNQAIANYLKSPSTFNMPKQSAKTSKHSGSGAQQEAEIGFPPTPKNSGAICYTNCLGQQCFRSYSSGQKVSFRPLSRINPSDGQLELDSGSCLIEPHSSPR